MKEQDLKEFEYSCKDYLSTLSIGSLRAYGRQIGVAKSTEKKKENLIAEIVAVLSGKLPPSEQSRRGAPVKNDFISPKVLEEIERLKLKFNVKDDDTFGMPTFVDAEGNPLPTAVEMMREQRKKKPYALEFHSSDTSLEKEFPWDEPIYRGQLEKGEVVARLLPLNGVPDGEEVVVLMEFVQRYDLREGDVISCYFKKNGQTRFACKILTVNEVLAQDLDRNCFEESEVCYPFEPLSFYDEQKAPFVSAKYLDWLIPVRKGQRGCILSVPKAGKTQLLFELAQAAADKSDVWLFVLLLDQSPETVAQYRRTIGTENVICTTYEDDCDRQVFAAEFLLKRAKRFAESGKHVLMLVDSLNALGRAYNDTDASSGGKTLAGGLESKTLYYLKKFFGTARRLKNGGSLTMIGAVSLKTGNPADDIMATELSALSNYEIRLSSELATERIYPSIDYLRSRISDFSETPHREEFENVLRKKFLPEHGQGALCRLLSNVFSREELEKRLRE